MRRTTSQRGSATAETAVVLPALVVVLVMAIWVLACVGAQLRCVDAARAGARAAARGESGGDVMSAARRVAPRGAAVSVTSSAGMAKVAVRAEVRPFGAVLSRLPATAVASTAVADVEQPGAGVGGGLR